MLFTDKEIARMELRYRTWVKISELLPAQYGVYEYNPETKMMRYSEEGLKQSESKIGVLDDWTLLTLRTWFYPYQIKPDAAIRLVGELGRIFDCSYIPESGWVFEHKYYFEFEEMFCSWVLSL